MTNTFRTFTAAALIAAGALAAAPAHAGRVIWSVGIGAPGIAVGASNGYGYGWSTDYYAPAPVYYSPAPVYYAPVPVYGTIYYNNWRPHHRHVAPPPPRRHWAPPPGRHPGAPPVHHNGGHRRPPHGRR